MTQEELKRDWKKQFEILFKNNLHLATKDPDTFSGLGIQVDGVWSKIEEFIEKLIASQNIEFNDEVEEALLVCRKLKYPYQDDAERLEIVSESLDKIAFMITNK